MPIRATSQTEGDLQIYTLSGQVDERLEAWSQGLPAKLGKSRLALDCADVASVNSVGAKLWVELMKSLQRTAQVELRRCPVYLVDYMNLLPDMAKGARITSCFAPFVCRTCRKTEDLLVDTSKAKAGFTPGPVLCKTCATPMELETPADQYFGVITAKA